MSDEPEDAVVAAKRPRHRSPSYPAFDLEVAVQRAQTLSEIAGRHAINVASAMETWGYSPKSSRGKLAIAALKKFGLLQDEGSRDARTVELTSLARELIVHERGSPAWELAARRAVFMPEIHLELWNKYDCALPSDKVVSPGLVLERGFSVQAAADLLAEFRSSLDFAGISQTQDGRAELSDPASDYDFAGPDDLLDTPSREPRLQQGSKRPYEDFVRVRPDRGADIEFRRESGSFVAQVKASERREPLRGGTPEGHRNVVIPYSPGEWAVLQAPFPISESEFAAIISMLQAMKLGLVREAAAPAAAEPALDDHRPPPVRASDAKGNSISVTHHHHGHDPALPADGVLDGGPDLGPRGPHEGAS